MTIINYLMKLLIEFTLILLLISLAMSKIKNFNKTHIKHEQEEECPPEPLTSQAGKATTTSSQVNKFISYMLVTEGDDENNYNYVRGIHCNLQSCSPPNYCLDNTICKCGEGKAQFYLEPPAEKSQKKYCTYDQKYQIIAFLLELFLPGIGHFYIGKITHGFIKILLAVLSIGLIVSVEEYNKSENFQCGGCLFSCMFLALWMIDIVNFGSNTYRDGNGVPLESW